MGAALNQARLGFPLEQLQVRFHFSRALIAMAAILFHRLADDAFQFARQFWIQIPRWDRLLMQHGIERDQRVFAGKRFFPRGHLVHHHAKRKQITAGIDGLAARLLG